LLAKREYAGYVRIFQLRVKRCAVGQYRLCALRDWLAFKIGHPHSNFHDMSHCISSERAIENLIARYAFLVDDGDFAGLGQLLDQCTFTLGPGPAVMGGNAIAELAHRSLRTYEDGTPRTRHITTNILIEVDEAAGIATSRSYYTVLQSLPEFALQPIACGTYVDRFERRAQEWFFKERSVHMRFAGDTSHHRR
jgi:3-phenylpropionate/cinnamic acid dioxygenase small subunit